MSDHIEREDVTVCRDHDGYATKLVLREADQWFVYEAVMMEDGTPVFAPQLGIHPSESAAVAALRGK